ncbi:MAG: L-seryl-tRNA(Sec) selenium transferase [Chloroflexota bacterium]|nr:L-seryl-tRNA(Sec) selenium transferase [Chloroflexota bacterium]
MDTEFRGLPSVDKLLSTGPVKQLLEDYPHDLVVDLVRQRLQQIRQLLAGGKPRPAFEEIVESIVAQAAALGTPSLRPVINATGVILHTNLGRAPLSGEAIAAMAAAARGYCNLEFDLASGTRGSRNSHVESLLCQLTGAEAALVVNNNAAAVLLALMALAKKKEVIVSRGQAVEIGGGFRIPDVMRQSGAKLVEVGTTNSTYIADYEQAISPKTAALLRVHSSNFKVVGFTHSVTIEEMVTLAEQHGLPVFDDIGSGCLLDVTRFGLDPEPMVQQSVAAGVALTLFSGDKLLGGPQAGIIVGRKELVDRLKKHPLARAIRIDKLDLAGLAATLIHYLKGEALSKVPVWRMISAPLDEIDRRAKRWAESLGGLARVEDGETMIGGGSLPGGTLPTRLVAIGGGKVQALSEKLRHRQIPVIGRISGTTLLLDPRSVLNEEDDIMLQALHEVAAGLKSP